ncbi:NAD(P)-dependent oxidoreductase [Actinocorallia aurea]
MDLVVFGAGGRAGRRAVAEGLRRGHRVTAVVRDPARHPDVPEGARIVAGDVTDPSDVDRAAAGHDAAVNAAAELNADPHAFFTSASRALSAGLVSAGVGRLVAVGLSPVLPGPSGVPLVDEADYPPEHLPFILGHAAGLAELRSATFDWLYAAPTGDFDHTGTPTGHYTTTPHSDPANLITYPDFALALLDQIDTPTHHRTTLSIASP